MGAVSKQQMRVLKFLVDLFNNLEIKYYIDDGLAAIVYGSKRKLYDIDLCVEAGAMKKLKEPFNDFAVKPFAYRRYENCDLYITTLKINKVPIDMFTTKNLFLKSEYQRSVKRKEIKNSLKNAQMINFKGISLSVIKPEYLIVHKAFMNRKTDFQDIKAVIKNTSIDKKKVVRLAGAFHVVKKIGGLLKQ